MIIKKVVNFEMDQNCYIVFNEKSTKCIIIDPGSCVNKIKKILEEEKLEPEAVLLTHCHYDHISGIEAFLENTEIIGNKACSENIRSSILNVSKMFGCDFSGDFVNTTVSDGEIFKRAGLSIKCIETPGHTSCSVCYLIEDSIFSGDTLFLRTTGRWDLPTGSYDILKASIQEKLYKMDNNLLVYPGHGEATTVGYEKKFNMSINAQD